jgi:hypothetical protein
MEYFHISYIGGVPLPYPIIQRLNAVKERRRAKLGVCGPKMADATIALVTKIRTVQITVERLDQNISALNTEIAKRTEQVDECIARRPPTALVLEDEAIGFRFVASIDAFLYGARSTYEMLLTFVVRFTRHILKTRCKKVDAERTLEQAMVSAGHSVGWVENLRRDRAAFFHETSPWIAM